MNEDYSLNLNLTEICRLCLSHAGKMVSIFDNNIDVQALPTKIMECVSVEIVPGDGLPDLICFKCSLHVDKWYQFKKQCQNSEATLRRYIDRLSGCNIDNAEDKLLPSPTIVEQSSKIKPRIKRMKAALATCRRSVTIKKHNSKDAPVCSDVTHEAAELKVEDSKNNKVQQEENISVNNRRGFLCHLCNRTFSSKSYLRDHQAIHTGERNYSCSECGKRFYSGRKLTLHLKTHSSERTCLCSICGKAFREKSDLKKHFRLHSEESPFLCNVCGKTFKTKFYLTRHLTIHSGEKHHTCAECGKAFTWRDTLMAHAKVHALERPLVCTVCSKGFKRKEDLMRHLRIHTGEKPFVCPHCTRRFSDKWNLTQHIRLHTGHKPYVCSVCCQAFTHNVTLRNHIKQHHPQ